MRTKMLLLAGAIAVLVVASLVGALVKWRFARGRPHTGIDNANARIKAWWVMVALLSVALLAGRAVTVVLFAFMSFAALREYMTLFVTRPADHPVLAVAFYVVLPIQYALVWSGWHGLFEVFIPAVAFLLLPMVACAAADTSRFLERIAATQWGLLICVYGLSHLPALLTLDIPGFEGRDVLLIAWLVIVVQGCDVLQYLCGKLLGKHPIAPVLSPSKTLEGLLGGLASATLLGALLYGVTPFSPLQAGLLALVVCAIGFGGGLVMSAIKRDRGVKDWGTMIEGHGGMLDRLDSLVFAAPVFYL
ncbi:MAG: phosphatidate cytidylyltransferase, partial [Caldimonas sp.]